MTTLTLMDLDRALHLQLDANDLMRRGQKEEAIDLYCESFRLGDGLSGCIVALLILDIDPTQAAKLGQAALSLVPYVLSLNLSDMPSIRESGNVNCESRYRENQMRGHTGCAKKLSLYFAEKDPELAMFFIQESLRYAEGELREHLTGFLSSLQGIVAAKETCDRYKRPTGAYNRAPKAMDRSYTGKKRRTLPKPEHSDVDEPPRNSGWWPW